MQHDVLDEVRVSALGVAWDPDTRRDLGKKKLMWYSASSRDCAECRTSVPGTSAFSSCPCSRMVTEASSSDNLATAPLQTSSMARLPSPDVKLFTIAYVTEIRLGLIFSVEI